MKIDIWSDIACPFCYIGITQLKAAIGSFAHGQEVELTYHSFELDPEAPKQADESMSAMLERKKSLPADQVAGMLELVANSAKATGLTFNLDKAQVVNTFDAHRLMHLAAEQGKADAMLERLYRAYFTDGMNVADIETLTNLASDLGIEAASVRSALKTDQYADAVKADIEQAAAHGIQGVPFFIVDGKYGLSGAQGEATFSEALAKIWHEKKPIQMVGGDVASVCRDGLCI